MQCTGPNSFTFTVPVGVNLCKLSAGKYNLCVFMCPHHSYMSISSNVTHSLVSVLHQICTVHAHVAVYA